MAISFDNALGIHQHSVGVRSQRAELLASNLANASTPGYKARGLDFAMALQNASSGANIHLSQTDGRHVAAAMEIGNRQKFYRVPTQPDTGDGNTVDTQLENALFMQNTLEYQASLDFLGAKFKNLVRAIKGE